MYTDRSQTVSSTFSTKHLEDLPIRVQRFRLRMMRLDFEIVHVPGKELVIADTLSRAPIKRPPSELDMQLQQDTDMFVNSIVHGLPVTDKRLEQINNCQSNDHVCQQILEYTEKGWPPEREVPAFVKPYYSISSEISICDNILLRGSRIIVPISLRQPILDQLHSGHQGIQ